MKGWVGLVGWPSQSLPRTKYEVDNPAISYIMVHWRIKIHILGYRLYVSQMSEIKPIFMDKTLKNIVAAH